MTAADIVNQWDAPDLVDLFRSYGEVRSPQRVVRAVVNDRKERPFTDTTQLSSLIERVDGWRKKGAHPATKYFLALRLKVNRELEVIQESLPFFVSNLKPDGRLAILTFHSLEDRIVKHGMRQLGVDAVNKKVIVASREEQKDNVRSRSAKLRVYRKAHQADD